MVSILKIAYEKLMLQREVHQSASKYLKAAYVCMLSIGKIIRKVKAIRKDKLNRILNRISETRVWCWKVKYRIQHKKNIIKYTSMMQSQPNFCMLVKSIVYNVVKIQRIYKRRLIKRIVMLNIMNALWNALEVIQSKTEFHNKIKAEEMDNEIRKRITKQRKTQLVPILVRLFYLCSALKRNKVFIGKCQMMKLISKALLMKTQWNDINQNAKNIFPIIKVIMKK